MPWFFAYGAAGMDARCRRCAQKAYLGGLPMAAYKCMPFVPSALVQLKGMTANNTPGSGGVAQEQQSKRAPAWECVAEQPSGVGAAAGQSKRAASWCLVAFRGGGGAGEH
jgi:hypothetical protein